MVVEEHHNLVTCLDLQLSSKLAFFYSPPVLRSSLQSTTEMTPPPISRNRFCSSNLVPTEKVMLAELRTYFLRDTDHKKLLIKDHGFVELPHTAALVAAKAERRNAARRTRSAQSAGPRHRREWSACRIRTSCWRKIIAVVDNDARARRTQARLNLALERGELHMACWLLG